MKKILLLVGVAAILATKTIAQTTPPSNAGIGQVLDLHGTGVTDGKYIQWAISGGGDYNVGWLKKNTDGSSHQLYGKFKTGGFLSRNLESLFVIDTKTGLRTNLLPNTSGRNWVLSWVGPNWTILNRNSSGLFFGTRGRPSSMPSKEISGAYESPMFNLTVDLSKGPQPPLVDGTSGTLGSYTTTVSSTIPVSQRRLEVLVEVDDAQGVTVRKDTIRLNPTTGTALSTKGEYTLGAMHQLLPPGEYTLHFELRDRSAPSPGGKFLAGATKIVSIKTVQSR